MKCHSCNKTNHVKKVCISTLIKTKNSVQKVDTAYESSENVHDTNNIRNFYGINTIIIDIYEKSSIKLEDTKKFYANIKIDGKI